MNIYCDVVNQRFVRGQMRAAKEVIRLTQNDDQPLRIFMVQPSRYPGSGYPFYYTEASGNEDFTCIISLRDVTGTPLTLASTAPMTVIVNGFEGVLHLNTQEVATFLAGHSQRDCDLCIDLIDSSGYRISSFRGSITLRATDAGEVTSTVTPGIFYLPLITGYTGGGATNADGIESVGRAQGSIFMFVVNGSLSQWRLEAGTAPTDTDAGIIQLLDSGLNLVRVEGL